MANVLLLHGFPFSSRMWAPQQQALEAAGHRVFAPDFPGFGQAAAIADASMEKYAEAALQSLDDAGVKEAVVCGLSMGGYVAFRVFRKAPTRVLALFLADTRSEADTDEQRAARMAQIEDLRSKGNGPWFADALLPMLLSPAASSELLAQVRQMIIEAPVDAVIGALQAMAQMPDSTALLAEIAVPTATVVGEHDLLTPLISMSTLTGNIFMAKLVMLGGAGHLSNLEQPEAFNHALLDLLARIR